LGPRILLGDLAVLLATFAVACSSSASGTIKLVTGQETDTFTRAPVPAKLAIDSIDSSGNETSVGSATLPAATIDLGSFDPSSAGILRVLGYDASGMTKILCGQTVVVLFGGIEGATLPLFVQRTGEMARLPNPPPDARPAPVTGVIAGRYVVATGGTDPTLAATTMVYDLASLSPVSPAVTLPETPTSMAFVGLVGWLVNDAGVYQYNFSNGGSTAVTLPTGPSFMDISGGATVSAPDGSQYIVGATRTTGDPTKAVLAIDASGNPSWLSLSAARLGAAAAWLPSVGLVVTGGSSTAAGAETIAVASTTGASTGSPFAYPPDPSIGAGAAVLDGARILVAGGILPDGSSAGARVIDVSCTAQCVAQVWHSPAASLVRAQVFAVDSTSAVVVGSEPATSASPGLTHVYQVTSAATTEVPTKVAHTLASALASPIGIVGSVLLVGGAPALESLGL
jgi:hypothetical protein